jgi:hypothetical protein
MSSGARVVASRNHLRRYQQTREILVGIAGNALPEQLVDQRLRKVSRLAGDELKGFQQASAEQAQCADFEELLVVLPSDARRTNE